MALPSLPWAQVDRALLQRPTSSLWWQNYETSLSSGHTSLLVGGHKLVPHAGVALELAQHIALCSLRKAIPCRSHPVRCVPTLPLTTWPQCIRP